MALKNTKFYICSDDTNVPEGIVEIDFKYFNDWYYNETRMVPTLKVCFWISEYIEACIKGTFKKEKKY